MQYQHPASGPASVCVLGCVNVSDTIEANDSQNWSGKSLGKKYYVYPAVSVVI